MTLTGKTVEKLLEAYPEALLYLRGDFNTNKNNHIRCTQLASFIKTLNVISINIPHNTYHHFVGQGRFDSKIDLILHSKEVSKHEQVTQIWCRLKEPEISSHHDLIISKCYLSKCEWITPPHEGLEVAPRTKVERVKVRWSEDGVLKYHSMVERNAGSIAKLWYCPASASLTRVYLQVSNLLFNMAAARTNKVLVNNSKQKTNRVPASIKRVKNQLRRAHRILKSTKCNSNSSSFHILSAECKFNELKKEYKKTVRQVRASTSINRDLRLNHFNDVYKYIRSLKNAPSSKLRKLVVGDQVYSEEMVPDGFYKAMSSVKTCDMNAIKNDKFLTGAIRDSEHVVTLSKVGQKIPPLSIEKAGELLQRLKKNVTDVYGLSTLHFLNGGIEGVRSFALLMNSIILNVENAKIKELNTTHGLILYKGGLKEKSSERSYRTISTCPIVAKALDLYLRDLYQEMWNKMTAPTQYQKQGSSHELASLLLTETIQFSFYHSKKPVFLLVLDAQSAFDRCLKEVLCTKFYAAGICDNSVNVVMNRLANRSTIYEWDKTTMGPANDQTGFEQGGINSGDYYKLYNNEQLQIAQDSLLGVDIKSTIVSAIGQADDVILATNCIRNLQLLAHLTERYCKSHRVTLVPSKTKLLVIYPRAQKEAVEYAEIINQVKIAGVQVPFTDEAEHVGIVRSRSGNLPHITKRISAHKKALAALCSVGIAKGHRGSPSSALKLQQLYGTSVLLSGVASLVLNRKEINVLESHYKQIIERIQKLHSHTPRAVVYFLAGTLPIEGIIHSRQLALFSMICRLKSDLLHYHAKYVLTALDRSCKSWFFGILELCRMYNLPHPLSLLESNLNKEEFKRLVKMNLKKYWTEKFRDEISDMKLKSLELFHESSCLLGRPHLIWEFSKNHPFEVSKAIIVARMMSGRYRTDKLRRHWTQNKEGFCLAPTCQNVVGDIPHMFVSCPAIRNVRCRILSFWKHKSALCPPLLSFLSEVEGYPPKVFAQFIVNPTLFPEVARLCQIYGLSLLGHIFYLTRTYAFHIDRFNCQLRTN